MISLSVFNTLSANTCEDSKKSWEERNCCTSSYVPPFELDTNAYKCTTGNLAFTSGQWGNARRAITRIGDDKFVTMSRMKLMIDEDSSSIEPLLKIKPDLNVDSTILETYKIDSSGIISQTDSCTIGPSNQAHTLFDADSTHFWYIEKGLLYRSSLDCKNKISVDTKKGGRHFGVKIYGDHVYAMVYDSQSSNTIGIYRAKKDDLTEGRFFPVGTRSMGLANSNGFVVTESHILTLNAESVVTIDQKTGIVKPVTSSLVYPWTSYPDKLSYTGITAAQSNTVTINGNGYMIVSDSPSFDPSYERSSLTFGMKKAQVYKVSAGIIKSCEIELPQDHPVHLLEAMTVTSDESRCYMGGGHAYNFQSVFFEVDLSGLSTTGGKCTILNVKSTYKETSQRRIAPVVLDSSRFIDGHSLYGSFGWTESLHMILGFPEKGMFVVTEGTSIATVKMSNMNYIDRMFNVVVATDNVRTVTTSNCGGTKEIFQSAECCGESSNKSMVDTVCTFPTTNPGKTGSWDDLTEAQKSNLVYGGSCYDQTQVGKWIWREAPWWLGDGSQGLTYITPLQVYNTFASYGFTMKTAYQAQYVGEGEPDFSICDIKAPPPPPSACANGAINIQLIDAYGDGWNKGSYLTVLGKDYTLDVGSKINYQICLNSPDECLKIVYNGIGTWHTENSVKITANGKDYTQKFGDIGDQVDGSFQPTGKLGLIEFSFNANSGLGCGVPYKCTYLKEPSNGQYVPCEAS